MTVERRKMHSLATHTAVRRVIDHSAAWKKQTSNRKLIINAARTKLLPSDETKVNIVNDTWKIAADNIDGEVNYVRK